MNSFFGEYQALWASLIGLAALLILILRWRTNAFITLLGVAIVTALLAGMAPEAAYRSVQNGMGGTLGFIAPVIGLGAIFGAILERSGSIEVLADKVDGLKSDRSKTLGTGLLGLIAATPVFFDVALIILMPFILRLARKAKKAPLFFGLPVCAGLAIGHGFIPPTPGPIIIAGFLDASLAHVIMVGGLVSLVCLVIAGPMLTLWLNKKGQLPEKFPSTFNLSETSSSKAKTISFPLALSIMLLPIMLILSANFGKVFFPENPVQPVLNVIGHPFSALIIACIVSWWVVGPKSVQDRKNMSEAITRSFEPTALVILVTGAGGAFKQVLTDSGAGNDISGIFLSWGLSPVLLGFTLALMFRVLQGSATVAMTAAAGLMATIVIPLSLSNWQLAIISIAIAAGATGVSHVNDSGFWLVNRLFDLSEAQTLKTWALTTTVIAVSALILCMCLYGFTG